MTGCRLADVPLPIPSTFFSSAVFSTCRHDVDITVWGSRISYSSAPGPLFIIIIIFYLVLFGNVRCPDPARGFDVVLHTCATEGEVADLSE